MNERRRWVTVTGASSGIGKATALVLAAEGWNVVVHYCRSKARAEETVEQIRTMGASSELMQADLTPSNAAARLVHDVWELTGECHAWFHNAGVDLLTGQASGLPFEEKLELAIRVDLSATIIACREAGRRMREQGGGTIVTMGWDQASTGMEGDSGELFAAVKGGVMAFTRSLAKSLAPTVRVHCVAPGWIRTRWGEQASQEWQSRVRHETLLGRWGKPEDVAHSVAFLLSERAAFMTGQTVFINGGAITS